MCTRALTGALRRAGLPASLAPLLGLFLLAGASAGCRAGRPEAAGTQVATGDVLSGRLAATSPAHAAQIEGVESSLLDFTLQSDELNRSSPRPRLLDPEGRAVELEGHRVTPEGAATTRYEGVVLLRTGTYRLELASADTSDDSWYLYRHTLRFPSIVDDRAQLGATGTHPISFSAPYGGTVTVRVRPVNRSALAPEIRGVIDPSGGRALDASRTPQGVNPPQIAPTIDGGVVLVFVAPHPGRYTVLAAAKPGHEGEARIDVDVGTPNFGRNLWHPGSEPGTPLTGMRPGAGQPSVGTPATERVAATAPLAPPSGGWSAPAPAPVAGPATEPAAHLARK